MDFPFLQLSIFLLLAAIDTGNAVYNRYVAQVESKVRTYFKMFNTYYLCDVILLHYVNFGNFQFDNASKSVGILIVESLSFPSDFVIIFGSFYNFSNNLLFFKYLHLGCCLFHSCISHRLYLIFLP